MRAARIVRFAAHGLLRARNKEWCPGTGSNRRHCDFQSHALPTELPGHRAVPHRLQGGLSRLIARPAIWSAAYRQAWAGLSIAKSPARHCRSIIFGIGPVSGRAGHAIAFAQPVQQVAIFAGLAAKRREIGACWLLAQGAGAGGAHGLRI